MRLASILIALSASAVASQAVAADGAFFHDGRTRVEVERVGPPARDALGRELTPVRLAYPGRAPVAAEVDRTAILSIAAGTEAEVEAMGVHLVRPLMPSIGLWLAEDLGGADGVALAQRLTQHLQRPSGLRNAIPNLYLARKLYADPFTPDDPSFPAQWFFENLKMTDAWGLSRGAADTTIVVIDSGCDMVHPDLVSKLDPGRDVIDGDDDPSPEAGFDGAPHGTECAGLVGAATNNGEGVAGACPECRLRCVRMLTDGSTPISADLDAFQFAFDVGAAVVSNSWGFVDPIPVPLDLAQAIDNVFHNGRDGRGTLVLFASGNDDRNIADNELQALPSVLSVGAINNFDDKTSFTNYGASVDLVAPTGTFTTDLSGMAGSDPTDYTGLFGGTSSACPVAAGIAGLLVSAAPERSAAELYEVMVRNTRPAPYAAPDATGHDPVFGYGIVDPVPSLEEVLGITGSGGQAGEAPAPEEDDSGCAIARAPAPRRAAWIYPAALALFFRRRRK